MIQKSMKKWLTAFLLLILLLLISVYFLIPHNMQVSVQVDVRCTVNGANRVLQHHPQWSRWWPDRNANSGSAGNEYLFNGWNYKLETVYYNQYSITVTNRQSRFDSRLSLIPYSTDSLQLFWTYPIQTGYNPIKKVKQYLHARKIKHNAEKLLLRLKAFLEKPENIYGIHITTVNTPKVYLVALSKSYDRFPSTDEIYALIRRLSAYVTLEKTTETGYPMLNVTLKDNRYQCMVALPVSRELPGKNDIVMRRIVTVKALSAEVIGGRGRITNALHELEQYVIDYRLFSPAIPFESLVTNRLNEPDTTKWITRVYQPLL
jgi:hypothetical protein